MRKILQRLPFRGTPLNTLTVIVGASIGLYAGKLLPENMVAALFLAAALGSGVLASAIVVLVVQRPAQRRARPRFVVFNSHAEVGVGSVAVR